MADISNLVKLFQELEYRRAGGGKKSTAYRVGQLFSGLGTAASTAGTGFTQGANFLKAGAEAQKARRDMSAADEIYGLPSEEDEAQAQTDYENNLAGQQQNAAAYKRTVGKARA